jgi:soluble lytic murein transglycosylase-like protein
MAPRRYLIGPREPAITTAWTPYSRLASQCERGRTAAPARRSLARAVSLLSILSCSVLPPDDIHARSSPVAAGAALASSESEDAPALETSRGDRALADDERSDARTTVTDRPSLRAYTKAEVQTLIRAYARRHGIDPDLPLAIAACESGFRWNAENGRSSARGVFQYLSGTWRSTKEGRNGTSVLDADANIRMAVSAIASSGTTPWAASRHCWDAGVRS